MKTTLLLLTILLTIPLFGQSNKDLESKWNIYSYNTIESEFVSKTTDNSIKLFNKEIIFGMSSDEFISIFNEFKFDSKDGTDLSYKYETNYSNSFDNYLITAKFKNNKLICLELNGWQTVEYMRLIDATLKQFQFDKTVTEKDEDVGTISSDYYHKDDLKAEYFNFETAVLKICLNK